MRLIDADALREKLGMANECKICKNGKFPICFMSTEKVCDAITEAPTIVEVKPGMKFMITDAHTVVPMDYGKTIDPVKHGKWMRTPTWWAYCSVCGMEPPNESNCTTDYCPNCGARMEDK